MSHCRVLVSAWTQLDTLWNGLRGKLGVRTRWALNAHVYLRDSSHVARPASASWRWCHRAGADGPGATATVDVAADVVTTTRTPMTLFCVRSDSWI